MEIQRNDSLELFQKIANVSDVECFESAEVISKQFQRASTEVLLEFPFLVCWQIRFFVSKWIHLSFKSRSILVRYAWNLHLISDKKYVEHSIGKRSQVLSKKSQSIRHEPLSRDFWGCPHTHMFSPWTIQVKDLVLSDGFQPWRLNIKGINAAFPVLIIKFLSFSMLKLAQVHQWDLGSRRWNWKIRKKHGKAGYPTCVTFKL